MGVAVPPQITEAFATSGTANTIPVPSQIGITPGAASFTDGFPPLTATPIGSGGIPPSVGDMNGILKMISAHIAFLQSGAGYQYSSTISTAISGYNIGAVLLAADNTGYWMSTTNNNTTNPDTGGAGWVAIDQYGVQPISGLASSNVTLTAPQWGKSVLVLTGALTANINIVFPALVQGWIVVNQTTGAFTITCKTASGTGTVVPNGGWPTATAVQGDGTNLYSQAGTFVTNASLATTLASYVTSAQLATSLSSYVTSSSLASQLANYVTTGTLTSDLANYLTTASAASTYVSNSALTSALASYLTTASAAATYVTQSLLNTTLSAYITATSLTSTLSNYLTAATAASTYATQAFTKGTGTRTSGSIWQLDPSGVMVQTGITPSLAGGSNTINFPTSFATACVSVNVTPIGSSATYAITGVAKGSFTMNTGAAEQFYFVAYGY